MTIYGILNQETDFVNIAYFLRLHEEYFKNLLNIETTPSHDCLSDLFASIDPEKFLEQFILWVKDISKGISGLNISIDGKAVKSARDKINGGNTPYILSAFLSDVGLSIGQIKIDEKSNEMTSIPDLLDLLEIEGATITIDAIGTQTDIINKILKKKAHYVLKVKDNQKDLKDDIKTYFDTTLNDKHCKNEIMSFKTDYEKDHGRIEKREYYLSYNVDIIFNKEKWDSVNAVGMVRTYKEINGELSIEDYYYIMDTEININHFMKATRSHWSIENKLHWKLDVIFDEDHQRNRVKHSIENITLLRKIIFNLIRLDDTFDSKYTLKKRLLTYSAKPELIENLIYNVLPTL